MTNSNEERKVGDKASTMPTPQEGREPSLQKTSKKISDEISRLFMIFNYEYEKKKKRTLFIDMINQVPFGKKHEEYIAFKQKKWLPADKVVLIEDVENIVKQLKPKPNHQTNAQGCGMLFDELILKIKSLK